MTDKQISLCGRLKAMGFTKGNQVKLYGDVFELLGEPIAITDTLVLLYGRRKKSGELVRVRLPLPIVRVADRQYMAA